jgi:hypothetical protein
MFYKYILDYKTNQFDNLANSINFEKIIDGRLGTKNNS